MTTRAAPRPSDARRQANEYHEATAAERRRANHHRADLYPVRAARAGPRRPAAASRSKAKVGEFTESGSLGVAGTRREISPDLPEALP